VTRRTLKLLLLLLLAGLLALSATPARAAESLVLTCSRCDRVVATGKDLPPSATVRLTLTDVRTGQQVGAPTAIHTDGQGDFTKTIMVNLSVHQSLEASIWQGDGQVLVVAAHNRIAAPCHNGMMEEMGGGMMGEMGETLAFTGAHSSRLLGGGVALLVAGGLLLLGTRRARRGTP
jgi:hypothetical protein